MVAASVVLAAATPAVATTTTTTTSAEITAPLKQQGATKVSALGEGDDEFRRIFGSWEQLEDQRNGTSAPVQSVSIPSGNPLNNSRLTSGFGMRTHPVLGRRRAHKGIDLAAPTGTPVYATADGLVSRANWFSSYGRYISIEHGGEIQTRFAHLSRIVVAKGQRVKKGDLIGYVGSTGRSTGPHLHYEIRVDGRAMNPMAYMKESAPTQGRMAVTIGHDHNNGQGGK